MGLNYNLIKSILGMEDLISGTFRDTMPYVERYYQIRELDHPLFLLGVSLDFLYDDFSYIHIIK